MNKRTLLFFFFFFSFFLLFSDQKIKERKKLKVKTNTMSEEYYDQKLKAFLGSVLQANGYQDASVKALDYYADSVKKCAQFTNLF